MPHWPGGTVAKETYDAYAGAYDDFNHSYMYERWTGRLLAAAMAAGGEGRRLLDVGCGTGLSSLPMVERGWNVTGCDISEAMLVRARQRLGPSVPLLVLDMRDLPRLGEFDLVWAVNDAVNYLLTVEELEAALQGMRRNLGPNGRIVFDVNTLTCYRSFFSSRQELEHNGRTFTWNGAMSPDEVAPASINEATFVAGDERDKAHVHRQRHFTETEIRQAFDVAGLKLLSVLGERDGQLSPQLDEEVHTKAVYVGALD